ncbi:uncharacterized protein [Haliotis asinina]|uniref:uncharacterized protein n=1 Tax=Haliotis asinina TaxID=109174 RepID=UPI003531A611
MYASAALACHQAVDDHHRYRTHEALVSRMTLPSPDSRPGVFTITVNPLYSLPDPLNSLPVPASRTRPQVVEMDLGEESQQPQSCSAVLVSCVKHMFQSFFTQK